MTDRSLAELKLAHEKKEQVVTLLNQLFDELDGSHSKSLDEISNSLLDLQLNSTVQNQLNAQIQEIQTIRNKLLHVQQQTVEIETKRDEWDHRKAAIQLEKSEIEEEINTHLALQKSSDLEEVEDATSALENIREHLKILNEEEIVLKQEIEQFSKQLEPLQAESVKLIESLSRNAGQIRDQQIVVQSTHTDITSLLCLGRGSTNTDLQKQVQVNHANVVQLTQKIDRVARLKSAALAHVTELSKQIDQMPSATLNSVSGMIPILPTGPLAAVGLTAQVQELKECVAVLKSEANQTFSECFQMIEQNRNRLRALPPPAPAPAPPPLASGTPSPVLLVPLTPIPAILSPIPESPIESPSMQSPPITPISQNNPSPSPHTAFPIESPVASPHSPAVQSPLPTPHTSAPVAEELISAEHVMIEEKQSTFEVPQTPTAVPPSPKPFLTVTSESDIQEQPPTSHTIPLSVLQPPLLPRLQVAKSSISIESIALTVEQKEMEKRLSVLKKWCDKGLVATTARNATQRRIVKEL
eukprot:c1346_g1_i1.p1 GENE.c1346_g1_i1~~c1346_g1_i1.p1  ORF type:complete len:608 (-),score=190.77 c1346_g1_i1:54-1634(-)